MTTTDITTTGNGEPSIRDLILDATKQEQAKTDHLTPTRVAAGVLGDLPSHRYREALDVCLPIIVHVVLELGQFVWLDIEPFVSFGVELIPDELLPGEMRETVQ